MLSNSTQSSPNSQPESWQTPRLHTSLDLTAFSTSRFHRSLALQICCCKWPLRVSGLLNHWGTLSFYWYDFHTPEFLSLSYWFCPATAGEITRESLWYVTGRTQLDQLGHSKRLWRLPRKSLRQNGSNASWNLIHCWIEFVCCCFLL